MNRNCLSFSLCLPYNFEDRLEKIEIDTCTIDLYRPSLEDLAVMKLYRFEDNDKEDLTNKEFLARLNWSQLDYLINDADEAKASRVSEPKDDREFKNLKHNYEIYKEWRDDEPEL